MRRARLVILALLAAAGCDTWREVCEDNCDKRAECFGSINLEQCRRACGDEPEVDGPCLEAATAHQECIVELSCDAYATSKGCEAELRAAAEACRP